MRILIVEDEVRLAEALAQIMAEQKYQVDQVHNGANGLDYALTAQYDVIVLDVMLPKKNGFDVCRHRLSGAWGQALLPGRTGHLRGKKPAGAAIPASQRTWHRCAGKGSGCAAILARAYAPKRAADHLQPAVPDRGRDAGPDAGDRPRASYGAGRRNGWVGFLPRHCRPLP